MSRPSRHEETARKLIAEVGLNKEVGMSAGDLAQLIDCPSNAVSRVLNIMQRVGLATRRDIYTGRGHTVAYTLTGDYNELERQRKQHGIPWSAFVEEQQGTKPQAVKPQNGAMKSLADLGPLRKSEPRAELEIARKYRDQQSFILAKREEFKSMGLDMPEPAPMYDEMRIVELTAIVRVLPYVESLERSNETLETQNKTIRAPMAELGDLRRQAQAQKEHIERLVAEKAAIKDDVQRVMDDHKTEVRGLRDQIGNLEGQLRQIRGNRAINGAIAVEEVKAEIVRELT